MPYSITTKDGITIQNIPDELPADAPELKQRVATIRAQMAPPKPTDRQELLSSAPMRMAKGGMDAITGTAQLLQQGADPVLADRINRGADTAGDWLNRNVFNKIGLPGNFAGEVLGIRGMTNDQMKNDIRSSEAEYQGAREATAPISKETGQREEPGFDGMRLAGNVVNPVSLTLGKFLPGAGAGATTGSIVRAGATAGAAGAATQPAMSDNFAAEKLGQVALGAGAGAVLGPVASKLGESVGRLVQRWSSSRGAVNVTPERLQQLVRGQLEADGIDVTTIPKQVFDSLADDVRGALAKGKELNPAAALRAKDFEALQLPYMQGQVSRVPGQWQKEFNLMGVEGVGEPLQAVAQQQSQGIGARFRAGASGAQEQFNAGQLLGDELRAANERAMTNVRQAYGAFRQSTGRELEVPMQGLAQDYATTLRDYGQAIPGAVRSQFEELGLLSGKQLKTLNIEDAERLLKVINKHYGSPDSAVRGGLDELRRGVQKAIVDAADSSGTGAGAESAALAAEARGMAAQRFQMIEGTPALRAAIGNAEPDDFVRKYVIGGKVNEIGRMLELLGPEGRDQAKAQMVQYLQQKAFGANVAGDGKAAQAAFNTELQKIGRPKLEALLGKDGAEEMLRIGRVLAYIKQVPEGATPNTSGTGQMLTSIMGRTKGLKGLPFVNDYVVQPVGKYLDRQAVKSALSGVPSQPAQLDPKLIDALSPLFTSVPLAGGIASVKAIR